MTHSIEWTDKDGNRWSMPCQPDSAEQVIAFNESLLHDAECQPVVAIYDQATR